MDIPAAIVKFGVEAILRYRTIAGLAEDNHMPEIFLGGFIAPRLYELLGLNARVEQPYLTTARDTKIQDAIHHARNHWDGNADITIYDSGKPSALIELKKLVDRVSPTTILADQTKLRNIAGLCRVEAFLGVFVTDDERGIFSADRVAAISKALGHEPASVSDPILARSGQWHWRMAAWKVPTETLITSLP